MYTASSYLTLRYFFLFFFLMSLPSVMNAQGTGIQSGTISFSFVKKGVSGTVSDFSSTSIIDWNELENSLIEGQVAAETIKTGNFLRDFALRRAKYFDVDTYPLMTFRSTDLRLEEKRLTVQGTLTLKGISKPLTIVFQKDGSTLTGTATLFTSDFDITILKTGREANKVVVTFTFQLE